MWKKYPINVCGKLWEIVLFCVKFISNAVMAGFLGEYEVSLDSKNRFLVPSGFRKQLAEGEDNAFVISRGMGKMLSLYTKAAWEKFDAKLSSLNDFNPNVANFVRVMRGGATEVQLDSAGRMLVPKPLQVHAGLDKDLVFSAMGDKVEIWDKDTYYNHIAQTSANIEDLANGIFGDNPFK
jgi:MraZ protein